MEKIPVDECPLCHGTKAYPSGAYKQDFPEAVVRYWTCLECGLMFQRPRFVINYADDYRELTRGRPGQSEESEKETELMRSAQIADAIRPYVLPRGLCEDNIVDVGSSCGFLLGQLASMYPDSRLFGVEPNNETRKVAESLPGATFVSDFSELPDMPIRLVTCIHVLEHMADPLAFMQMISRRAQYVFIEVPYGYSKSMASIFHPTGWGWGSVMYLMRLCGFEYVEGTKLIHSWPILKYVDNSMQALFRRKV